MVYSFDPRPNTDGWIDVDGTRIPGGTTERVRVRVELDASGRYEIRELHFLDLGEPISARRLRALNLGTLAQMVAAAALITGAEKQKSLAGALTFAGALSANLISQVQPLTSPPQRGYGDEFYERVAARYQAALTQRERPVAAIAAEAGVPRSTAARWAKEARKRGFLGGTSQGKARP